MNSPIYKASKEGDDDNKSMPRTPVTSDLCRELREEFLQRRLLTTQNRSRGRCYRITPVPVNRCNFL